jgi:pimeloyl-ACP methyl ester carboxylesterase
MLTQARDCFTTVGGLRLHYVDYGGSGGPLVLVHGTGLMARIWDELAPAFSESYRTIAFDRRGHGDSDKPDGGYQFRDGAEEFAGFCAALGLGEVDAVGHSAGGSLLIYAAQLYPGLIRRAVLIDPIMLSTQQPEEGRNPLRLGERIARRRFQWPGRDAMITLLRTRPPYDTWSEVSLRAWVEHGTRELPDGTVELKCLPEVESKMYQHDPSIDVVQICAETTAGLRIIHAEQSDRFRLASAERACAVAPDCRMVTMAGVTHFAPMEQPEVTARLVLDLLREP